MVVSNYKKYCTHFDKEELRLIFSLEMLQMMYKFYNHSSTKNSTIPKDVYTLTTFLHLKVKKQVQSHLFLKKGDLVRNLKGDLLRIKEIDFFDVRLGKLPLVYDIHTQASYAHVGHLTKVEEVEFAENVSVANRIRLAEKLSKNNFVQVDNKWYTVGILYVLDDATAKVLIDAEKKWSLDKKEPIIL